LLDRRINKLPLTIDGDGTDTRDYIHVTDVVRACIIAAEHPDVSNGELFNIATGIETSLNTLAAHIGGKVIHLPNRSGSRRGPNRRVADILHAKTVLGWVPNITIEEGIQALKNDLGIS
jgi:UDP-glucose 4-epimerase